MFREILIQSFIGLAWEDGYQAAQSYSFHSGSPTAFISCNNLLARGALRGFLERGIRVPDDLSLIGYDDLPELAHVEVPITTVGPSLQEIARLSAEMIVQLTKDQELEAGTRLIQPVLHERKSVARVRD
ncbi:MAG: hypothetical protein JWN30_652 [Bacilli bacterium]|nr:hypothetical protein [Bacilli bacterium]